MGVVCAVITIYIIVLFARAIFSWFPTRPGTGLAQINRILADLTDWILRPMRRVIPPIGMFDLSLPILLFFLLIVRGAVGC